MKFLCPAFAAVLLCSATCFGGDRIPDTLDRGTLPTFSYETGTPGRLPEPLPSLQSEQQEEAVPTVGAYARDFIPDLWYGTRRIFSNDNVPVAAVGFGAAALGLVIDSRTSGYFDRNSPLHQGWMDAADTIGNGTVEIGAGIAMFGAGELFQDRKLADTGMVSLEAFLVNGVLTESLKFMTHRKRPNGGDNMSFPSGHASVTAAFAASVSEMYDWNPWITVPLYLTAGAVGAARIQAGEHHFSDVVAGITLGTLVGSSFARYHKEEQAATASKVSLVPIFDRDVHGAMLMLRF